jgi:hypothetical protein
VLLSLSIRMAFLVTWMVLAGIMSLVARSFCDKPLAWRKHTHTHTFKSASSSEQQARDGAFERVRYQTGISVTEANFLREER